MGKTYANEHDDPALKETCWPCPDSLENGSEWDHVNWRLRYGTPSKSDLYLASAVMSAYESLLSRPPSQARKYIAALRRVVHARGKTGGT